MNRKSESRWKVPDSWVWTKLSALGDIVAGGTPSTKVPTYWADEIAWISPADLTGYSAKTIVRGAKSISRIGLEYSSAKVMPAGSVHFSTRAPIGHVVISTEPIATNQGFKSLVPAPGIFNEYVYYYLMASRDYARERGSGTTFLELSGSAFGELPVPLAPTATQHKVVAKIEKLFSELDKGIERLKAARAKLDVYRQAVLKHAFEGKLTALWREENKDKLETPVRLLARIKQEREARYEQQLQEWKTAVEVWEEGGKSGKKPANPKSNKPRSLSRNMVPKTAGRLPSGWIKPNLLEVVKLNPGIDEIAPEGNTMVTFVPMSKVKTVTGNIDVSEIRRFEEVRKGYTPFKEGDVLFAKITPCMENGKMAVVPPLKNGLGFGSTEFHVLRPSGEICSQYIYFFVSSGTFRRDAAHNMTGAVGQRRVPASYLESQRIPFPSVEEQRRIVAIINELFSSIEQKEQEINTTLNQAEMLRQSILRKAFSGKLVPQDSDDEPASILLERIKGEKAVRSQFNKRTKHRREKTTA